MINFDNLRAIYSQAIGIQLYKEFGEAQIQELGARSSDVIIGTYRINPSQLTAVTDPFIGTITAEIEILCPPSKVDDTVKLLNRIAAEKNGTSFKVQDGNTTHYTVTYNCQTCSVGSLSRVGWFGGKCYPIRQIITYSIIEKGISSNSVTLRVDGYQVPLLSMTETRVSSVSNYTDSTAISRSANDSESYGVDFTVPYLDNELGEIFRMALSTKRGNIAHSVEVRKNGISKCYIMSIANIQDSVQPPLNVGYNVSMVEIDSMVADYPLVFQKLSTTENKAVMNVYTDTTQYKGVIYFGDGTGERSEDFTNHVYIDDKASHDIMYVPDNPSMYRAIQVGDTLLGKRIYCDSYSATLYGGSSKTLLTCIDGTSINTIDYDSTSQRAIMVSRNPNQSIQIDKADNGTYKILTGKDNTFVCTLRGKVTGTTIDAKFYVNVFEV